MALVSLHEVTLGFIGPPLLENANLQIEPRQRVCLLGRNGVGKSTLMRLIDGQLEPDKGEVIRAEGLTTALLDQQVPRRLAGTVAENVAEGLNDCGGLPEPAWQRQQRVERIISQTGLDPRADVAALSAGWKRRVLLARALVRRPDVLMLDEPTNHLDIEAITWMEEFLARYEGTLLFVTHDRMFLRKLSTRIVELDRGQLTSWSCDHPTYLKRKQAALESEVRQQALFDKKLAQEEAWIRQGILARRTRNEGRVRALQKLREERRQRRELSRGVRMTAQEAERSGRLVIKAENVTFAYEKEPIVKNFSTTVSRGDKIGVIGPNGSGKTTLLNLLLGQLEPQEGSVRHGTRLEVSYFDQLHAQLNEEETVEYNVGRGSQSVVIGGKKKHILGYLQDFLFTPDRARSPVKQLSGGERNRLLLARLFTKPSNVLVMDEPTNDLDTETLELLEELLLDYQGTLLMVSHDRQFLNNVVTSTLVFEGAGRVKEYAGGYDDWLVQRKAAESKNRERPPKPRPDRPKPQGPPRLKYKEKMELETLPGRIETLEAQIARLHEKMAAPAFYQQDGPTIAQAVEQLKSLEADLAEAFGRWEALEKYAD